MSVGKLLESDYHGGNAPRSSSWLRDSVPGSIRKRSDDRFVSFAIDQAYDDCEDPPECAHRTARITIITAKTTMITIWVRR